MRLAYHAMAELMQRNPSGEYKRFFTWGAGDDSATAQDDALVKLDALAPRTHSFDAGRVGLIGRLIVNMYVYDLDAAEADVDSLLNALHWAATSCSPPEAPSETLWAEEEAAARRRGRRPQEPQEGGAK